MKKLEEKMAMESNGSQRTKMRRRNFSFRKMLCPRSACQVLSNLLGHLPFKDFVQCERVGGSKQGQIPVVLARIEYDTQNFESCARSKSAAENDCAEKVLMYITAKSCQEEEGEEKGETNIPWVSLASLALFNMFNHWEMQGCIVPKSVMRKQTQSGSPKPDLGKMIPQDEVKSFGVTKGFGEELTVRLPPTVQLEHKPTLVKGANKRVENVKDVPMASVEYFQPFKVGSFKEEKTETKTEHVSTDIKANQPDESKFTQAGFPLVPIQKSLRTKSELPESKLSSSPSSLSVPGFEFGWKHPMTLLNELAGPRLVFKEVSFKFSFRHFGCNLNC